MKTDVEWLVHAADELTAANLYSDVRLYLTAEGFDVVATRLKEKAERTVTWQEIEADRYALSKGIKATVGEVLPEFMR